MVWNDLMLTVSFLGTIVNGAMMVVTLHRRVKFGNEDEVSRISTGRALRQEATFFLMQAMLFSASLWALALFEDIYPTAPVGAAKFYYGTLVIRTLVSVALMTLTALDLRDRNRLRPLLQAAMGTPNAVQ
jgi:hypothetical protein